LLDVENIITDDLYFGLIKKGVDNVNETIADTIPMISKVFQYLIKSKSILKPEEADAVLSDMNV
jgi:hypothetical protein